MNNIQLLKQKIAKVEEDLQNANNEANGERKRVTLIDYIAYLKDELRFLEEKQRTETSKKT